MSQLKQLHAFSLRTGIDHTDILLSKLVEIPNLPYAHKLFDRIRKPTLFHCNKLIQSYSSHGPSHHCFSLYTQLRQLGHFPNQQSFTYLLAACTSLSFPVLGQSLHTHVVKSGFESNVYVLTALMDMYCKVGLLELARKQFDQMKFKDTPTWNSMVSGYARCGNMKRARELFGMMPGKNVISWTSMIAGYAQNGEYLKALDMFLLMEKEKEVKPNEVTIASVLPACANLGASQIGQRIELHARLNGFIKNSFVSNALLEMYAKCGRLDDASRIFDEIGGSRNLCTWNSMIMCLAIHGLYGEALGLFYQMLREGTLPDDVTFVGVLMACTHGGMVAKGQELFETMSTEYKISPKLEHYGCMVDLLGRSGKIKEAENLIQEMPMKPDSVIWGTLLGACSFYRNVEVAEKAADALFKLEPRNPGNYVILSNIYASARRWDGVAKVRKMMKSGQIMKNAGYSFIEEESQVHKFIADDESHPRSLDVYAVLKDVYTKMKDVKDEQHYLDCLIGNC